MIPNSHNYKDAQNLYPAQPAATGCRRGLNIHLIVQNGILSARRRAVSLIAILLCLMLTAVAPAIGDESLTDLYAGEFDLNASNTSLIRVVSDGFGSSLHASADSLVSSFNWRHLPLHGTGDTKRALAVSTAGPLASLEDLIDGRAELAIVRADLADRTYTRPVENSLSGNQELRLVSTHKPVLLHIIVRDEFDGSTLSDLRGKRINIGGEDAATMLQLSSFLNSIGLDADSYEAVYAPVSHALTRLETGVVDAVMFFDQAPSRLVGDALENRKFRLIGLPEQKVQAAMELGRNNSLLQSSFIHYQLRESGDFYDNTQPVAALSLTTFLLTREDVSSETIDMIINQLSVGPTTGANPNTGESTDNANKPDFKTTQEPFQISTDLSPIPLHLSSQLLLDIFTDSFFGSLSTPGTPAAAAQRDQSTIGSGIAANKRDVAEVE